MTSDWTEARSLKACVRREIFISQKVFINRQLDHVAGDSGKFWRIINDTFFKKKPLGITSVYKKGTKTPVYRSEAANQINDYFCNISEDLSRKFPPLTYTQTVYAGLDSSELADDPLDVDSVRDQILKIDVSKSSGFRDINAKMLKRALLAIPELFTRILNLCITSGIFPSSWKVAIVKYLNKQC